MEEQCHVEFLPLTALLMAVLVTMFSIDQICMLSLVVYDPFWLPKRIQVLYMINSLYSIDYDNGALFG